MADKDRDILLGFTIDTVQDIEHDRKLIRLNITVGKQPWLTVGDEAVTYRIGTDKIRSFHIAFPHPRTALVFADDFLKGLKDLIAKCEEE